MTNQLSISDLAFEKIKKRRLDAENRFYEISLFQQNEEVDELTKKINKLNRLIGKAMSDNVEHDELVKEKSELEKKLSLLFPSNDFNVEYYCKKCNDTGFLNGRTCECFKKVYNELLCEKLGIPQRKLATFNDDTLSKKITTLAKAYLKYSETEYSNFTSSLFIGLCGTGKSFLAQCIASKFANEKNVLFLSAFNLNNVFVKYHSAPIEEKPFYFSALTDCDLLIIDDLGTEPIYNKITIEYLFMVIDERRKNDKPFLITTNHDLKELFSRYGERVFSRLVQEGTTDILYFEDKNLRNF